MSCSVDDHIAKNAWACRLSLSLRYPQVISGVDFTPTLTFGHDVAGWSEDVTIVERRQFAALSLKAEVQKSIVAELSRQPIRSSA